MCFHNNVESNKANEFTADILHGAFLFGGDTNLLICDQLLDYPHRQHVFLPGSVPAVTMQHGLLIESVNDPMLCPSQIP